jgi:hypothetical protein
MNLDDTQKNKVTAWINEGSKLAEIQKRLGTEFGLNLTYMEVRMLVDDLKVMPKDPPPPPAPPKLPEVVKAPESAGVAAGKPGLTPLAPGEPAGAAGAAGAATNVSVVVDAAARPGTMVSGTVRFSDGQTGTWYMDQMGRLGVAPSQQGYKPSGPDVQAFQDALERELTKLGL